MREKKTVESLREMPTGTEIEYADIINRLMEFEQNNPPISHNPSIQHFLFSNFNFSFIILIELPHFTFFS